MSLATLETREQGFLSRFERLRSSLRRYQVLEGLAWSALVAAIGLAAMATADFLRELPLSARAAGLGVVGVVTLLVLLTRVVLPLRWWTRPRTAAEIEGRFPQLGQRIRTVVQYAGLAPGEIDAEGVTPSLVDALEDETESRAEPLPLDRVVPWWRARAVGATAGVTVVALLLAAAISPEWRIAIGRALLGRMPYTRLEIAPRDVRVDQGADVPIVAELAGRTPSDVVLYTRPEGQADAPWRAVEMKKADDASESKRVAKLEKVDAPLAYRIVAGSATSPTYRIDIRYPLTMMSFDVDLRPPAYTGVAPSTVKGGDLRVIERTEATFRVAFGAPTASASLVLTDSSRPSRKDRKPPEPRVIPLKPEGKTYMAGLTLNKGLSYRIEATTEDGRTLPESRYKIEVIEDRAPRVAFEEPPEALEVHPIAEVKQRVRVADDFGLARAGIVFQFGEGDEQTLVLQDFAPEAGKPRTSGALEEMLLLEKLAATPRSSVTYYAFAEDNNPNGPARTETELRYIDIRPFKREYKMAEPGDDMEGLPAELTSLAELIARQRFNLNRATRLAKHKPGDRIAVEDPLKIAGFEETLVELTRGFTEGIEGIVGQRIEPLHQAEESMLAAVSALDHGQVAPAPRHMADAVRHLIEARDTVRILIGDQSTEAQRAMRAFDRTQAQKIRKPKKDKEEAEEIAEEIEQLAQDEDFVYATLNGLKMDQPDRPTETRAKAKGDGQSGEPAEPKPDEAEKKDPRREAVDRQEKAADRARELEEALKKLELASDLARARMAKAADAAEKASVDLARGSTKEATETVKSGASMLHELARQLKGELADDVAEELAMARDLADELARRETELAQIPSPSQGSQPGDGEGDNEGNGKGRSQEKGQGTEKGEGQEKGQGRGRERGRGEAGGAGGGLGDADRLSDLEEAARTLEQWLKDASLRAEGPSAERTREALTEGDATRIVERMERIAELGRGGKEADARREAEDLSRRLELLSRVLDVLHRDIVAPELAKLVEIDRRIAELTAELKALKTDVEIAEWHRRATELIRDMEKAGLDEAAGDLAEVIREEGRRRGIGRWNWGIGDGGARIVPLAYLEALVKVTSRIQQRIQDMILKDMASARDEATPPQFKELVERYYEVLSKGGAK